MKLIIDRQKWGIGRLLRTHAYHLQAGYLTGTDRDPNEGKRCCLGFYCSALGVPDDRLDCGMPIAIHGTTVELPIWLMEDNGSDGSSDVEELVKCNDRAGKYTKLTDEEREAKIVELFAKHDVHVEFIN